MPMTVLGADALIATMRNIAVKVPDHARRTMNRGADLIVERAQLFTPVDTHALEQSIHKETGFEGRGRLTIDIVAGGGAIDDYASEVHENYEHMHPGPGTIAKREQNPGVYIGEKFLTRAVEEQEPKLVKMMIETIVNVMIEEGGTAA